MRKKLTAVVVSNDAANRALSRIQVLSCAGSNRCETAGRQVPDVVAAVLEVDRPIDSVRAVDPLAVVLHLGAGLELREGPS